MPALLKGLDPIATVRPEAWLFVIRSTFTIGARTRGQLFCDANLAESTIRKKCVTGIGKRTSVVAFLEFGRT